MNVSLHSNQALQASTLIGRPVYVPSNQVSMNVTGKAELLLCLSGQCNGVGVFIENDIGEVVRQIELGPQMPGNIPLKWDGKDDDGFRVYPGKYLFLVEAVMQDRMELVTTYVKSVVESVTITNTYSDPLLNVTNQGSVLLSEVRLII